MWLNIGPCTRTAYCSGAEAEVLEVYRCLIAIAGWQRGWTCHGRQWLAVAVPHLAGLLTLIVCTPNEQASCQGSESLRRSRDA